MKQKLRVFLTLLLCAVASVGWAEEVFYTLEPKTESASASSSYSDSYDFAINGITWNVKGNSSMNPWRLGGKSLKGVDREVFSKTPMGAAISKIELEIGAINITVNSFKLIVASDANFTSKIDEITATCEASSTITLTPTSGTEWANNSYYKFVFNVTNTSTSNKYVQFVGAKFYTNGSTTEKVATPTFSPAGGVYTSVQNVTISTATEDAIVYYTIDGTDPTTSSNVYSEPISVSETTTIKAMAVKDDMENSTVATAIYTIVTLEHAGTEVDPYTVADARNAIDANTGVENVYAKGIVSKIVEAYSSQYGNISYNISVDGTTTSDQLQAYRGKSFNGDNFTSEDDIQVGDVVVVYGTLKKHNETYEFDANNQLVSLQRAADVEAPVFSPEGGAYKGTQSVTITATTEGATIYYTTDGSTPTVESTEYTGAISVSTSTTLKAIAVKGAKSSAVVTARYAILEHAGTEADPYTVADARAAIDANAGVSDVYAAGIIAKVDNFADGAITYWISADGTADGDMLEAYKGKNLENQAFNEKDDLQVGDIVTIKGDLTKYKTTYEFAAGNYLVSFERPVPPVETPKVHVGNLTNVTIAKMWIGDDNLTDIEDGAEVEAGTEVFVEFTVAEGYTFESFNVVDADGNAVKVTENTGNWSFVMPESNVTISATAEKEGGEPSGDEEWVLTNLADLTPSDVFVIVGNNEDNYAMSNDNGTSSAPAAVSVTISGEKIEGTVADNIKWNISIAEDGYAFYPNGSTEKWLYCTNTNNGVRVGTNENNTFTLDNGYLKHNGTSRYVGIYNSQDWRCYTSINSNIEGQTFSFYKKVEAETVTVTIKDAGLATFCSDKTLDFSQSESVYAYKAVISGTQVNLTKVTKVPAQTGVLLRSVSGGAVTANIPVTTGVEAFTDNAFVAVMTEIAKLETETTENGVNYVNYILNKVNGVTDFYKAAGNKVGAHKAYLRVEANKAKDGLTIGYADETDGIRLMENGKLKMENAAIYNLSGQRVNKAQKGIYIVNGKKVVIR